MPKIFSQQSQGVQTISFVELRLKEIDEQIDQLNLEASMWNHILDKINICDVCEGGGRTNELRSDGDGTCHPLCTNCNGNGEIE